VYRYVYTFAYTFTHTLTCTHMHTHTYMHTHAHTHIDEIDAYSHVHALTRTLHAGGGGGDISLMPRSHSEGDQQQRELLEEKARLQKALRAMLDQQQLRAMLHQHDAMLDSRSTPQPQHLQHLQHAKSGGSALCADTVDVSSPPGAVPGW